MNLRFVPSEALPGGVNMAVDDALTRALSPEDAPICRFYRWSEPTVTAGRTVPEPDAAAAAAACPPARLFRRPTGGGVLYHGGQLSFSVIWPRNHAALRDLRQSYMALNYVLKEALADYGVCVVQASAGAADRGLLCSGSVERGDLTSEAGQKIAGGAQWRSARAVLYQGHLWLPEIAGLEQAIAVRLAALLRLPLQYWQLPARTVARAEEEQHAWAIVPAAIRPAARRR